MEKDARRALQCDSHIPETDGTCTDQGENEIFNLIMCYVDDVVIAPTLEDHID